MASTLRDDLASLKIERGNSYQSQAVRARGEGGVRLLSVVLWTIPVAILAGVGVVGYRQYEKFRPKTEVTVALVQAMTTGEAEKLLSAKGYLKSRHQAEIGAKLPGRVEAIYVEEGNKVRKGQVLAVLEHNDFKARLDSGKAQIERSTAELKEATADFEVKDRKARRWTQLLSRGTATIEETDGYVTARNMAAARLLSLEAAIHYQKAFLNEMEETIRNMHIIAPFDGTVLTKKAEVGETITAGGMGSSSFRGAVINLADLEHMEVETDVSENMLSRIAVGQPAEISVTAVPGKRYRGKLRLIVPMGDRTRGTIKVNVAVVDPDEHLFPELVATVHFLPDRSVNNPNAGKAFLFVPKTAVVDEAGHSYAWIVDEKGSVHKRPVEVVTSTDDLARVETGLKSGESVVVKPPANLRNGERVTITE
jgi:RND family efflux transporter MFP subunit